MALTRSDFEIIAKHMARERNNVLRRLGVLAAEGKSRRVLLEVADLFNENMRALCRAMGDINPRFNEDKFNEAIGGEVVVSDLVLPAVTPAPE